jgi:hypothetical protein
MSELFKGDRVVSENFSQQDPFNIVGRIPPSEPGDPECGWVLGWKSERLRNGSGMGWGEWEPLEFGDRFTGDNGEKLKPYIPDAPRRMRGPDRLDNLVRRADVILCRIVADIFDAKQNAGAAKSQARVAGLTIPDGTEVLPGVTTIGSGRKTDTSPTFGDKSLAKKLQGK